MIPSVLIERSALDSSAVKTVILRSHMDSLYYSGIIELNDYTGAYQELFKLGAFVQVFLLDDTSRETRRVSRTSIDFRILSVESVSPEAGSPRMLAQVQLSLVSPWFFEQALVSRAFFGSVSSIVNQIIETDPFVDARNSSIETSNDLARTRYQMHETGVDFLLRHKHYPVMNGAPMYFIGHFDRTVQLISRKRIIDSNPIGTLTPFAASADDSITEAVTGRIVPYANIALRGSEKLRAAAPIAVFTQQLLPPREVGSSASRIVEETQPEGWDNKFPSAYKSRTDLFSWDTSPYEAAAIAINVEQRQAEELQSATLLATGTPHPLIAAKPGNTIRAAMLQPTNWGDGTYMVRGVEHIISDRTMATKLTVSRVGL